MKDLKVLIELNGELAEDEIIIRCREINDNVSRIQRAVSELGGDSVRLTLFKDNVEYFLPLNSVLFFETNGGAVDAHTAGDVFQTKYKLYELEQLLPRRFIRVSKSAILNTSQIYSIEKNITSSSVVCFEGTHKKMYVSRGYYKALIQRLDERM